MRGCITKKGSKYYIVIDIGHDSNGKRKQKWHGGYKTKKEAEKDLAKYINEIENNTFILSDKITFGEYLDYWLNSYVEINLSPTTKSAYKHHLQLHVIPSLGHIQLQKLQPIHLQQLYDEKLKNGRLDGKGGLSAKSITNFHRVIRKALSQALKLQLVSRNVADYIDIPKKKQYQASVLNDDDIPLLLKAFKDTNIYIPVMLSITTGLRRGEALGLRWQDVDFKNKTITIKQTILNTNNGITFGTPKTKKSNRTIVVTDSILQLLTQRKLEQEIYKSIFQQEYKDYDLITCKEDGAPIHPGTFSHMFSRRLNANNLRHVRFHDLRHTNATLMLKSNIPAKIASERLGHSTIGITLDLYSHVLKEMQEEAANKLDNIIFNRNMEV